MTKIYLNGKETTVDNDSLTFDEIMHLVFGFVAYPLPTVQYTRGAGDKQSGALVPGQSVLVKDGTVIDVVFTGVA